VTTTQTRTTRIAGALATVAVALTAASASSAALVLPTGPNPVTQDGLTKLIQKGGPPCVCQPVDRS
jgi:hypothetical protein